MTDVRAVWIVLGLSLTGVLFYLLAPVLTPFLLSATLAYMFNPLISRLEGWRIPRALGVALLYILLAGLLTLLFVWLVPRMQQQVTSFAAALPGYLDMAQQNLLPMLQAWFGDQIQLPDLSGLREQILAHWRELGTAAGNILDTLTASGKRIVGWLVNLVLVPVVLFYLLRDWNRILVRLRENLPASLRPRLLAMARETDEVLGAFLRGQLLVMLALGVVYSTGLWLVGLNLALPIGILSGLVSFVPYLGFIVGIVTATIAAFFQFQDAWMLLWVVAVFGIGQLLEGVVLTPKLVGDRIGLHPVAVIFAVMAGGQLFGFFGVLLALPSAAALVVWLRHLHARLLRDDRPTRRARRKT